MAGWGRVLLQGTVIVAIGVGAGLVHSQISDGRDAGEEISLAEAKLAFDDGEAVFVDARFAWDFNAGHIPGALNAPAGLRDGWDAALDGLASATLVITYCTGEDCHASHAVARVLREEHGFRRVRVLTAGWPGWVDAGYPTEGGDR